jgi:hypothetical protein
MMRDRVDPLAVAILTLQRLGVPVRRVDEPWLNLYNVAGHGELTRNQVIDLAWQRSNSL